MRLWVLDSSVDLVNIITLLGIKPNTKVSKVEKQNYCSQTEESVGMSE